MKKRTLLAALLLAAALLLTACGNSVEGDWEYIEGTGEYAAAFEMIRLCGGTTKFSMKSGKLTLSYEGVEYKPAEGSYKTEGDKFIMTLNDITSEFEYKIEGKQLLLTMVSDGSTLSLYKK